MSADAIRVQVGFQELLDELCSEGAYVALLVDREGVMIPTVDLVAGRLFCSRVRMTSDGIEWMHEVLVDPTPAGAGQAETLQPFTFWTFGLERMEDIPHELWRTHNIDPDTEDLNLSEEVRIMPNPEGPRAVPERMREEASARWMPVFFPGQEVR